MHLQVDWDGQGSSPVCVKGIHAAECALDFQLSPEDAVWVDKVEEQGRQMNQPPGSRWEHECECRQELIRIRVINQQV